MSRRFRNSIFYFAFVTLVTVSLSALFRVTYAITVLGLSAWAALGHLVTLDDDMPGEWSNLEESNDWWHRSLIELGIKWVALLVIFAAIALYPQLKVFGA